MARSRQQRRTGRRGHRGTASDRRLTQQREDVDAAIVEAVHSARAAHRSWSETAAVLGVSEQAAQRTHSELVARASPRMFVIIWRYEVQPARTDEFVAAYGPDGDWARLFHRSSGFIGVDLVADELPNSYTTIDRWQSEATWRDFMDRHRAVYQQLDRRLGHLTTTEQLVSRGPTID